ncbi:MAG TPA: NADH-quinone oxidoreductase subunit NuoE [Gammaproteobacteria bacterium]
MKMTEQQYVLPQDLAREIDHLLAKFPPQQKRSAVLGALTAAQHENNGYLTTPIMDAVADYLQLPRVSVYEVASFYSMYETKKVGCNSISICTNISCMLRGADRIVEHVEKRLGIKTGESTHDDKFFLKCEEECLAACCGAPMMQINHKYYENLTPEKVDQILDSIK